MVHRRLLLILLLGISTQAHASVCGDLFGSLIYRGFRGLAQNVKFRTGVLPKQTEHPERKVDDVDRELVQESYNYMDNEVMVVEAVTATGETLWKGQVVGDSNTIDMNQVFDMLRHQMVPLTLARLPDVATLRFRHNHPVKTNHQLKNGYLEMSTDDKRSAMEMKGFMETHLLKLPHAALEYQMVANKVVDGGPGEILKKVAFVIPPSVKAGVDYDPGPNVRKATAPILVNCANGECAIPPRR